MNKNAPNPNHDSAEALARSIGSVSRLKAVTIEILSPDDSAKVVEILDRIERDHSIRRSYQVYKAQTGSPAAIRRLAEEFYTSEKNIERIIYHKPTKKQAQIKRRENQQRQQRQKELEL